LICVCLFSISTGRKYSTTLFRSTFSWQPFDPVPRLLLFAIIVQSLQQRTDSVAKLAQ
jgi:hypothetical protein